jgi:hypothetical protein
LHEIREGNNNGNGKLHLTTAAQQLRDLAKGCTDYSIQLRQVALGAIETLLACSDLLTSDTIDDLKDCHQMVSSEMEAIKEENAEKKRVKTVQPINLPCIESETGVPEKEQEPALSEPVKEKEKTTWDEKVIEAMEYDADLIDKILSLRSVKFQVGVLDCLAKRFPEKLVEEEKEERRNSAIDDLLNTIQSWPPEKIESVTREIKIPTAA